MERVYQLSPYHGVDNFARLHYGAGFSKVLSPCEPIQDLNLKLGVIDNNRINPKRLQLLPKDREKIVVDVPETGEICVLLHPGKSASICLTPTKCGPELVQEIVERDLGGQADRRDHLHLTSIALLSSAGWIACWAPIQAKRIMLHARMVADRTFRFGEDPTNDDVLRLAQVFTKVD